MFIKILSGGKRETKTVSPFKLDFLLYIVCNQDSVVLVKEQTDRSVKQNREPRNRHTNIVKWSLTEEQRQVCGGRIVFWTSGVRTTGHPHAKKWI